MLALLGATYTGLDTRLILMMSHVHSPLPFDRANSRDADIPQAKGVPLRKSSRSAKEALQEVQTAIRNKDADRLKTELEKFTSPSRRCEPQ